MRRPLTAERAADIGSHAFLLRNILTLNAKGVSHGGNQPIIMLPSLKTACVALTFLAMVHAASAKQVMTLVNGKELEVEIVTMGTEEISYRLAGNPDGPIRSTARSNVFFIVFDNGTKEIITPQTAEAAEPNNRQTQNSLLASAAEIAAAAPAPKNYFPHITVYPRASVGYQGTFSGYEDSFDLEWCGLAWSADLNVLFPSSNTSAWTVGLGLCGLQGDLRMMYTIGDKAYNDKVSSPGAMYMTIPIGYYYKCGDWFTFGFGDRLEFLVQQKVNGHKVKDTFNAFRDALFLNGLFTVGKLDLGAEMTFNLINAFKGSDLDWSPTIGINFTAGFRF